MKAGCSIAQLLFPLQVLLEEAKETADSFNHSYQSLRGRLSELEEKMRGAEPIHSDGGAVKEQLEDHKV